MNRKIKLIWDFHGSHAKGTAEHHCIHLGEFAKNKQLATGDNGVEHISEMHSLAYLVVLEEDMVPVRDALRPQRAELAE